MSRRIYSESVIAIVEAVRTTGHTVYGNPIKVVTLRVFGGRGHDAVPVNGAVVEARISDNSMLVYEIENPEFRTERHVFDVTTAGRLSGLYNGQVASKS